MNNENKREKNNFNHLKHMTTLIKGIYAQIRLKQLVSSDHCLHKLFNQNINGNDTNVYSENQIKIDFLKTLCQYDIELNYDFVNKHNHLFKIFYEKNPPHQLYSEKNYYVDEATIDVDFYYSVLAHLHLFLMLTTQNNLIKEIKKVALNRFNLINLFLKDNSFNLRNNYKQFINFNMQHVLSNKSIVLDQLYKRSQMPFEVYEKMKPLESSFFIEQDIYNEGFDVTKFSGAVIQHFEVVFKFAEILIKNDKVKAFRIGPVILDNERLIKKKISDRLKTISNNLLFIKRKRKPYRLIAEHMN